MDPRKWFLLEGWSVSQQLRPRIKHVPCSEHRSPSVLRLFLAGFTCGFRLTTPTGEPTAALRLMAEIMGAQLVTGAQLPPEELEAFGKAGPTLGDVFTAEDGHWYLRDITERVRQAQSSTALPAGREQWHWIFLPGLDGAVITYKDPDGRRRKRQCWIASCPPNWEMTTDVYKGVFRWTREFLGPPDRYNGFEEKPWPDAYTLLRAAAATGSAAGDGSMGGVVQVPRPAAENGLSEAGVGVQHGATEGAIAEAAD